MLVRSSWVVEFLGSFVSRSSFYMYGTVSIEVGFPTFFLQAKNLTNIFVNINSKDWQKTNLTERIL